MKVPGWLYDLLMAPLERAGLGGLRRRLFDGLRGRILELGVGTGRNAAAAVGASGLVAVDRSLAFLKRARARGHAGALVCADAAALPFRDGSFDAVVEALVFCSLSEPARALGEIRRVLKDGGELRMVDHVLAPGRLGRLQQRLAPAWLWLTGECHLDRDVGSLLIEAGVAIRSRELSVAGAVQRVEGRKAGVAAGALTAPAAAPGAAPDRAPPARSPSGCDPTRR